MKRRTLEEIAIERIGREAFAKIAKAEGAPAALRAAMHRMLADQHQERALDWGLHHAREPMTEQQHPTREELAAQLETVTRERDEARYVLRHASAELEDKNPRLIAAEKELLELRREIAELEKSEAARLRKTLRLVAGLLERAVAELRTPNGRIPPPPRS